MPSIKTTRIKRVLAKKQKQNRPIPYWIRCVCRRASAERDRRRGDGRRPLSLKGGDRRRGASAAVWMHPRRVSDASLRARRRARSCVERERERGLLSSPEEGCSSRFVARRPRARRLIARAHAADLAAGRP